MKDTDLPNVIPAKKPWQPMQLYLISSSNVSGGHNPGFFHEHSVAHTTKLTKTPLGAPGITYRFHKIGAPPSRYTSAAHPLNFYYS